MTELEIELKELELNQRAQNVERRCREARAMALRDLKVGLGVTRSALFYLCRTLVFHCRFKCERLIGLV